ncbi:protein rapunzel-like [Paramormyrops kingsleyae]|uniref:protein rapunzel-like n=1 Tax=Paramormyrops kingsleyae TaxID=1676925 RepID=UPI003B96B995
MADNKQLGKPVSSFRNDLLTHVTRHVGAAQRNPIKKLDGLFQKMQDMLDSSSADNEKILRDVRFKEVCKILYKYEGNIKYQFSAFISLMEQMQKTPSDAWRHMDIFKDTYERNKSDLSLDVYYRCVMETGTGLFGRPLLKVYSDHCGGSREAMELMWSYLTNVLLMGFTAHLAYTAITEDSREEFKEKWSARLKSIKVQMQGALSQCKDN